MTLYPSLVNGRRISWRVDKWGHAYLAGTYHEHAQTHVVQPIVPRRSRWGSTKSGRDVEITALVAAGLQPLAEIGEHYNLTRERVRQIAKRNGVDRGRRPVPARPRIGSTTVCRQCAERYPSGQRRAHAAAADHPFRTNSKLRPSDIAWAREQYLRGYNYREIGETLGVHLTGVRRHLFRVGIVSRPPGRYPRGADRLPPLRR